MTTTIAAGPLSETLQTLVDARLDTIDRMLLGRVNRQDRLAIVREVESQIFDLLPTRDSEVLDRDDVLAVLARLDPPEAYLADDDPQANEPRPSRLPGSGPRKVQPANAFHSRIALASGILGIVGFVLVLALPVVLASGMFDFDRGLASILFFAPAVLSFIAAFVAIGFSIWVRLQGGWSITGLVTGILSLLCSGMSAIFLVVDL